MPRSRAERRFGPLAKSVFALGDHTVNLAISALALVFFVFLTDVAGLRPSLAGLVVWVARVFDALTDPIMGRLSDRTRWKAGRRRPYFLLGCVPFGLCFAQLWHVPVGSEMERFAYYCVVYIGLSLSMTVLSVPYMALIPEIATGYDERTSLNTYRSAGAVLGTILAAGMNDLALGLGGGAPGFAAAGAAIAIWLTAPWIAVWAVSFERADAPVTEHVGLREGLRALLRHRTYLRLCGLYLSARVAVDVAGLAFLPFFKYYLERESDFGLTLLSLLVMVLVSLPLWLRFSKRSEKHRVLCLGSAWWVLILVLMFASTAEWPRWIAFALAALAGIGYAMADLMPWAMLGEAIDEGELLSGHRHEGLYNGVFTFLRKLGGATAFLLAGILLEASGYVQNAAQQPGALLAIRSLMTFVPALFLCIAIGLALRYPLTRARHQAIALALQQRQAG